MAKVFITVILILSMGFCTIAQSNSVKGNVPKTLEKVEPTASLTKQKLTAELKAFCISEMTDGIATDKREVFCNCWAEKLANDFSAAERKLYLTGDGGEINQELMDKVNKVSEYCGKDTE